MVEIPAGSRIITSDDVFDFMLNLRSINEGIDRKREELFEEYLDAKYSQFQMKFMDDYEQLRKVNMARKQDTVKICEKESDGQCQRAFQWRERFPIFFGKDTGERVIFIG